MSDTETPAQMEIEEEENLAIENSEEEITDEEEEEIDMNEYEYEDEDDVEQYMTMETLLGSTLMTEDGDTICSALVNMGRQLEIQNKILVKLLTAIQK
jgi:hypothetical protein